MNTPINIDLTLEDFRMFYILALDEVMQSPHEWESFNAPTVLDDRSEMTIKISDLVKK